MKHLALIVLLLIVGCKSAPKPAPKPSPTATPSPSVMPSPTPLPTARPSPAPQHGPFYRAGEPLSEFDFEDPVTKKLCKTQWVSKDGTNSSFKCE